MPWLAISSILRKHYRDFELYAELRGVIKPIGEFSEEELGLDGVKFNSIQTVSLLLRGSVW
jgi:hypothetical protein